MGPDQDLKNAPKAEQDAYWNWVGQMAADSDSGYYVPLSFRSWRSSYWSDEKGAPTYAPGMPPMASSRRKAVKIDDLRRIVENKQYENIDGMLVDGFTASAITQVFDALGPEAQQKYAQIIESDLGKASDIAFKLINKNSSRRTAADEPAQDGAAESTLPVAINPSDAPEGLDQLNENPQPATGMVGEGSGPAPQGAAAGGPTTFNDFVKDHTKAAAFRARVQSNLRRTAVSLTNVGLDGENGIGTDPSGNRVRFRLSPQDRKDLSSVLFSDLAINFSGVDVDESDIIREARRRPFVREAADDWKQRQDAAVGIAGANGISADTAGEQVRTSEGEMRGRVSAYIAEEVLGPDSGEGISSSDVNHTIYGLMYGGGEGLRDVLQRYASRKTAMPSPDEADVHIGDVFVHDWGYDQTNIDFYEVVGLTGASVKVRQVSNKIVRSDGSGSDYVVPNKGNFVGEEQTKRIKMLDDGRVYLNMSSYGWCEKWNGEPERQTSSGWGH